MDNPNFPIQQNPGSPSPPLPITGPPSKQVTPAGDSKAEIDLAATPSREEDFLRRLKVEIETGHYVFGGFLTVVGGLLTTAPRSVQTNGNASVRLGSREFTLLAILAWHAFRRAQMVAPPLLEPGALLPLDEFMAVEDILSLIDLLKKRHSAISFWQGADEHSVHTVVSTLRTKLVEGARTQKDLIETGQNGGYRLSLPPRHLRLVLDGIVYGLRDF